MIDEYRLSLMEQPVACETRADGKSYDRTMRTMKTSLLASRALNTPLPIRGSGFTLVELTVVMIIIALLLATLLPTTGAVMTTRNREVTQAKLKVVESTLRNFVAVHKRLPCPANGTLTVGTEARDPGGDCTGNQSNGVVPWVTLGLGAGDVLDAWNMRLSYRVGFGLTRDNALDMSMCDPASTGPAQTIPPSTTFAVNTTPTGICDPACTNVSLATNCTAPTWFLHRKGLRVLAANGVTRIMDPEIHAGAAYVVVSHGENTVGAYDVSGQLRGLPTNGVDVAGVIEAFNSNGPGATITTDPASSTLRDTEYSPGQVAATYFDDLILRPSLISVIQSAHLGPRSH